MHRQKKKHTHTHTHWITLKVWNQKKGLCDRQKHFEVLNAHIQTSSGENKYTLRAARKLTSPQSTHTDNDGFIASWGRGLQILPNICRAQHLKCEDSKSRLPVYTTASDKSLTHRHTTDKNNLTWINEEATHEKNWSNTAASTGQDGNASQLLCSCSCQLVPVFKLRWLWYACVCTRRDDTWLSGAALRSAWNAWETFLEGSFWNKKSGSEHGGSSEVSVATCSLLTGREKGSRDGNSDVHCYSMAVQTDDPFKTSRDIANARSSLR